MTRYKSAVDDYGIVCIWDKREKYVDIKIDENVRLNSDGIITPKTLSYLHYEGSRSSVARAFPGGRLAHPLAHPESQEENEKSLRNRRKNSSKFEEK